MKLDLTKREANLLYKSIVLVGQTYTGYAISNSPEDVILNIDSEHEQSETPDYILGQSAMVVTALLGQISQEMENLTAEPKGYWRMQHDGRLQPEVQGDENYAMTLNIPEKSIGMLLAVTVSLAAEYLGIEQEALDVIDRICRVDELAGDDLKE